MLEPDSPWRRLVNLRSGVKAGAAAVVGSLALGGVAAAATGVVPTGPLQDVAHFFGVTSSSTSAASQSDDPSESASSTESAEPSESESPASGAATLDPATALATATASFSPTSGPNPLGPAAWGLCHAFGNKTWGNGATASPDPSASNGRKPDNPSVAYQNLKDAAASVGQTVDGFCTLVLQNHGLPSSWPSSAASDSSSSQAPTSAASTAPSVTAKSHGHGHAGEHGKAKGLNRG